MHSTKLRQHVIGHDIERLGDEPRLRIFMPAATMTLVLPAHGMGEEVLPLLMMRHTASF